MCSLTHLNRVVVLAFEHNLPGQEAIPVFILHGFEVGKVHVRHGLSIFTVTTVVGELHDVFALTEK